jgi:hypothetical protein
MPVAMISGHLNLSEDEFWEHYAPAIMRAIADGHSFVVGDAPGGDRMGQTLLSGFNVPVTVYYCANFDRPRHNIGGFPTVGAGLSQSGKDAARTRASDYDIAWVRPGREDSGTARNLARRKKMKGKTP